MPIYEYVCPNCGHIFEKLMRGGSRARQAAVECPNCGEQSHRKEVTLVATRAPQPAHPALPSDLENPY